jgi:hypothetical protein
MTHSALVLYILGTILQGGRQVSILAQSSATPRESAPSEKASRTPAQQKIDSGLLDEISRRQGSVTRNTLPSEQRRLKIDQDGRTLVDIRAEVTPALLKTLAALKGTTVSTSSEYRSIIVWLPLLKLEEVAHDPAVHSIMPAPEAVRPGPIRPAPVR